MRAKAYPRTKPSGVEWLGDVPEHWEVKRSDAIVSADRSQLSPEKFAHQDIFHYSIPVVQETGTGQVENGESIASAKQVIKKPVVLVSKLNPRKATICLAKPQAILTLCSTEFVALNADRCELGFLEYLTRSELFRQGLDSKVQSVTRSHQRANPADIYKFWNAWPTLEDQRSIAAFLDRETGRVDRLVAKKRELIERLKEQRTALISDCVTGRAEVRMKKDEFGRPSYFCIHPSSLPKKPSALEWLGDIPMHWEVKKLGYGAHLQGGYAFASEKFDSEGVPVVRMNNLKRGVLDTSDASCVAPDNCLDDFALAEGDLLWGMSGSIGETGSLGNFARVRACDLPAQLNQRVGRFCVIGNSIALGFLTYIIQTKFFYEQILLRVTGTAQFNVSSEQVQAAKVPFPPLLEQAAIAAYLDFETAKLDGLVGKVEEAMERLQEYRTALITAAVTGKIDVRKETNG